MKIKDELLNDRIEKLKVRLKDYFKTDKSGHNIEHLIRTMNNALYLQSKEGGDKTIIAVSAIVHDVHRILSIKEKKFVSPKESLEYVKAFIVDLGLTDEQINHILHCVEHHEEYNFGSDKVLVNDIESLILQDADNLDAIGAIGVGRTFAYGSAHGVTDYDENIPLYRNDYSESKDDDASTIHHIYNKLMRLGKYMNTETAKKIAKDRTKFLEDFIDRYIDEWNGNFKVGEIKKKSEKGKQYK
jgi:uncharacterized protein